MKYRKKPVVIEAIQLTEEVFKEQAMPTVRQFMAGTQAVLRLPDGIEISTLEGNMKANINDWIIKGVNGEFYPCKPDIFEKTYQPADAVQGIKSKERGNRVAELYEANRPRYHDWGTLKDMCIATAIQYADEFIEQQGIKSKEECLKGAASELLHLHLCEQEGLQSGKPTPEMWFNAVNKLSEAIQSYSEEQPAFLDNELKQMTALEFLRIKFPLWDAQNRLEFNTICLREENLIEAMDEYADQFKGITKEGWISVETPPELKEEIHPDDPSVYYKELVINVIVYDAETKEVYHSSYSESSGFNNGNKDITHWMPLPAPPGQSQTEQNPKTNFNPGK